MHVIASLAGDRSDAVLATLAHWSAAGLLKPFVWWHLAEDPTLELVVAGERTPTKLGPALEGATTSVDLLGLCVAASDEDFDPQFTARFDEALEALNDVVPFDPVNHPEPFVILVPGRIGQPIPAALFVPTAINIYVAPENHSSPSAPNQLRDAPEMIDGHAASAVACLGELWSGQPKQQPSVLRQIRVAQGDNDTYVQTVQCFTRVVDGGYLTDHVAQRVLRLHDEWPNPSAEKFDRVYDDATFRPLRNYVVEKYFEAHDDALGLSVFEPAHYTEPRYGLLEALKLYFRFLLERLRRKPIELVDRAFGQFWNKEIVPRVERITGLKIKLWRERDALDASNALKQAIEKPPVFPDGAVASAWTDLRGLSIALIDGSDLPAWMPDDVLRTNTERRVVLPNPRCVVPDPREPFTPPMTRACDPRHASPGADGAPASVEGEGQVVVDVRESLVWEVGDRLADHLRQAQEESALPPDLTDEEQLERQEAQERAESRLRRRSARSILLTSALAAVGASYEVSHLALVRAAVALPLTFVAWLSVIGALLWRGHKRLRSVRKLQAEEKTREVNRLLLALQRRADAVRLARRYEEYLDWAEVIGWCAYRPWIAPSADDIPPSVALDPTTLPSSVVVGAGIVSDHRLDVLSKQASLTVFQPEWLSRVFDDVHNDAARDYLELALGVSDADAEGVALPNAAEDTSTDPDSPRHVLLRTLRTGRFQHRTGHQGGEQVIEFLCDKPLRQTFDAIAVQEKGDDAQDVTDQTLNPTAGWVEPFAGLDELAAKVRPAVVRIGVVTDSDARGGSGIVIDSKGIVATNLHVVEGADKARVSFDDGSEVVASVLRVSGHTDLALLELPGDHYPAVRLADEPSDQGDPVFTLGHPLLQRGEPTLSFGVVAAAKRSIEIDGLERLGSVDVIQMSYPTAPGASGSGAFNRRGEVVGIHCAASRPREDRWGEYMSYAVPTSELVDLLSGQVVTVDLTDGESAPLSAGGAISTVNEFFEALEVEPDGAVFLPDHWHDRGLDYTVPATCCGLAAASGAAELPLRCEFHRPVRMTSSVVFIARQHPATSTAGLE